MSNFCFEWSKDGLCINVAGEWLNAEETRNYLKHKKCCFNCFHGDFMGSHYVCDIGKTQQFVGIAGCCEKYERF